MRLFGSRSRPVIEVESRKTERGTLAAATTVQTVSLDAVWRVVTDYDHYAEFMPRTVEGRVERREGNEIVFATAIAVGPRKVRYRIKLVLDREAGWIRWTRVDGDMANLEGSWHLEDLGEGRTRITYTNVVDVGYRVPKWAVKALLGKSLPEVVEIVVARARASA